MEHTRARRPGGEAQEIPNEIIQAVESWLVDPRTQAMGTRGSGGAPSDAEFTSFLHANGLG